MGNIVFREGFDAYNALDANLGLKNIWSLDESGAAGKASLVAGRFGGQALRVVSYPFNNFNRAPLEAAISQGVVGFAFKIDVLFGAGYMVRLAEVGNNYQIGVYVNVDRSISLVRMSTVNTHVVLATSAPSVVPSLGTYFFWRLAFEIHNTAGMMALYREGESSPVVSVSSADTYNAGAVNVSLIDVGSGYGGISYFDSVTDDIYVTDDKTDLREPIRVQLFAPNGDGSHLDFTCSTGSSHYALVDDTLADSTDYLSGSTVGNYDELAITDMVSYPATILEANVLVNAKKTDAASRAVSLGVDSGGTVNESADIYLGSNQGFYRAKRALDPNTSAAWTRAAIIALKVRPKITV